jgi:hypothetical protein
MVSSWCCHVEPGCFFDLHDSTSGRVSLCPLFEDLEVSKEGVIIMQTCEGCGQKFQPRRDAKTCSDVCRAKVNYQRKTAKAKAQAERLRHLESLNHQVLDAVRAGEIGRAMDVLGELDSALRK